MLKKFIDIAMNDYKKGDDPLRIFKKSWARYKKHGFLGMRNRLEKEWLKLNQHKQNFDFGFSKYREWIKRNEKNSIYTRLDYEPLISVIIPTYNSNLNFLKKAIDSVLKQSYKNYEICISDDASKSEVVEFLKSIKNKKIKVNFNQENIGIAENLNRALNLAEGEWVVFLDHDDMLSPDALFEIAKKINEHSNLKLIYSDEDKIDENDNRFEPYFKSDWNRELFFSQNYINHLTAMKKEIIKKIGGFRKGFDGAQDYDLILRSLNIIKENEIAHIPKILYHWRAVKGSTALNPKEKIFTQKAGREALQDFFKNRALVIDGELPNTYKVVYKIPGISLKEQIRPFKNFSKFNKEMFEDLSDEIEDKTHKVSIIIPTRDRVDLLKKCIDSIYKNTNYPNYEIIIINNQSKEEKTYKYFENLKKSGIKIVDYDNEFNFSDMHNFVMDFIDSEYVVFMNNDIEIISSNWLIEMMEHILKEDVGVVGAKLYYPDNTIQHAGVILGIGGIAGHSHKNFPKNHLGYFSRLKLIQNYSAVTAALMMVKKSVYKEVGGMDSENLKITFNDVDLCLKVLQKGYKIVWTPYVEAIHYESKSRGLEDTQEKQERFQREVKYMQKKWDNMLKYDKFYNPNLTLQREDFSLRGKGE